MEERISKLEERYPEMIQIEEESELTFKKNRRTLKDLTPLEKNNIRIMGIP